MTPEADLEVDAEVEASPHGKALDVRAARQAVLVHHDAVDAAVGLIILPRLHRIGRSWSGDILKQSTAKGHNNSILFNSIQFYSILFNYINLLSN